MRRPYTYRVGWTDQNIYYYGVRWGNSRTPPEKDLWIKYYTSSPAVQHLREKLGEPDLVEVRKEFDNTWAARYWEKTVIRRFARNAPHYTNEKTKIFLESY